MPPPDGPAVDGRFVRVAVDAQVDRPERTFTYRWPPGPAAEPGALVLVPYGGRLALGLPDGGRRRRRGPRRSRSRPSCRRRCSRADLLGLAEAIAIRYRAPIGTTLAAMLPPGIESRLERRWELVEPLADVGGGRDPDRVPAPPRRAAGHAALDREPAPGRRAARRVAAATAVGTAPVGNEPSVASAEPGRPVGGTFQRADPRCRSGRTTMALADLATRLGRSPGSLLDSGAHGSRRRAGWSSGWADGPPRPAGPPGPRPGHRVGRLAPEQEAALAAIAALPPGGELLLQGVAASGKTDVILAAVEATLAAGAGAIVLVPELTLDSAARRSAAGRRWGSGCRSSTRASRQGSGTTSGSGWWPGTPRSWSGPGRRSSPRCADLGLIVLDEAHDGGYKADRTPRYDTRWVAARRAAGTGARLVLATATPDVVTVHRVRTGEARRARLAERRVGARPVVQVVDMRAELADGNRSVLSAPAVGRPERAAPRRSGHPADQPARRRHLRHVSRLRRADPLPGVPAAARPSPRHDRAALPP